MKKLQKSLLITLLLCAACGGEEPSSVTESELLLHDLPSRLTLYSEAGYWGDRMVLTLSPTDSEAVIRTITKTQIESAGLLRRISSIVLSCGTRATNVTLFHSYNTSAGIGGWSEYDDGYSFYCTPGQTTSINLHTQTTGFADRVGSVYAVAHARPYVDMELSTVLTSAWNVAMESLPDGAEAHGPPRMRLASNTAFYLRQDLRLDHWACDERGALMEFRARLMPDRTFSVIVTDTYVDTGYTDIWGCRSSMEAILDAEAYDASWELKAGLDQLAAGVGTHPSYYLYPTWSTREFRLSGGGSTPVPPVVARKR